MKQTERVVDNKAGYLRRRSIRVMTGNLFNPLIVVQGTLLLVDPVVNWIQLIQDGQEIFDEDASLDGEGLAREELCVELHVGEVDKVDGGAGAQIMTRVHEGGSHCVGSMLW